MLLKMRTEQQPGNPAGTGIATPGKGMFPNPDDAPAEPAQFAGNFTVALAVAPDLLVPKFPVRFRTAKTAGATVPKPAVHKNRHPRALKNKIRLPKYSLMPAPASDAVEAAEPLGNLPGNK